jgi:hypothetical protein
VVPYQASGICGAILGEARVFLQSVLGEGMSRRDLNALMRGNQAPRHDN